ncbi:MAG TPA: type II toxin-antitoxin system VapC family toxin [Salegentibacter sp.]|nr:type II toxin-antitoxin system VapC family toxin [Salegentibacter sp.]
MKFLLDTNICIHFMRGNNGLLEKFQSVGLFNCAISEITLAELSFGAENSTYPDDNRKLVDNFANELNILPIFNCIPEYAKEKVRLRKKGKMISDFDLLIGTTAVANNLIMVTENLKEFKRISNISLENWVKR